MQQVATGCRVLASEVDSWGNAVRRFAGKFGKLQKQNKTKASARFCSGFLCSYTRREGLRQAGGKRVELTGKAFKAPLAPSPKEGQDHTQGRMALKPYFYTCE